MGCYDRADGGGEHGGRHRPIVWGGELSDKKIKIKICHGLKRPPYDEYTQQPTKKRRPQRRGRRRGGAMSRTCVVSTIPSFWGRCKLKKREKNKIIVEFIKLFFLGQILNLY